MQFVKNLTQAPCDAVMPEKQRLEKLKQHQCTVMYVLY